MSVENKVMSVRNQNEIRNEVNFKNEIWTKREKKVNERRNAEVSVTNVSIVMA